ncbi:restriction endonuclease subunit S [Photobacterium damselae]|uniref:restriction endonuclease subunit S n=1 Tax=Photobacterium damselae TaxID=38293 RepID=UPI0012ADC243|nr:restriction endonuclease subunit S [Photobacterium damselae]
MSEQMNVPKLRFGEFYAPWQLEPLSSYLMEHKEKTSAKTEMPVYTSSRTGLYPQSSYFDNRELQNDGEYGVVPVGFFVYRHMSDDSTFKFNINKVGNKIAVSKEYPVFTTNKMDSGFLLDYLNNGKQFKAFAVMQKQGGTRTRLYFKKLITLKLPTPSLKEQQKIASFLSKVDEKIALLTEKKDKLTEYKKGVMQQLFNGKWEKQGGQLTFIPPTLRFKADDGSEFPDWEEKKLGDVLTIGNGRDYKHLSDGDIPVFGTGGYMTSVDGYLYDGETVFIGRKGTINKPYMFNGKFWTVDTLFYTKDFKDILPKFVYAIFQKVNWSLYNEATGVPSLSKSTINKIRLNVPSLSEQEKITEFISSLDQKIDLVNEELEKANEWKKGLLQQMFV